MTRRAIEGAGEFRPVIEAEEALLGSMLTSTKALEQALALVDVEDLGFRIHQTLFGIMADMHARGEAVDPSSVVRPLLEATNLTDAEAALKLGDLCRVGWVTGVPTYAEQIRDTAGLKKLNRTLANAQGITRDSRTLDAALEQVDGLLDGLRVRQAKSRGALTINAAALMSLEIPPAKWAVPSLIPEGLTILVSKPKIGKSWLAYQLGIAIACGGVALGSVAVEQGEVLLLMLEDTKRRAKSRVGQLLGDMPAPPALEIATEWPRMDDGGRAQLESWLKARPQTRLVVIDTLEKFRARRSERGSAYGDDYEALGDIKKIADRFGVSIIVIHHERKGSSKSTDELADSVSGTAGVTGAADGMLRLQRERKKATATLEITGRDVEEAEYGLTFDVHAGGWTLMGDAEQFRRTEEEREVIELIERLQRSVTPRELSELLGVNRPAIKQRLWRMAERGLLLSADGYYSVNPRFSGTNEQDAVTAVTCHRSYRVTDDPVTAVTPVTPVTAVTPVTPSGPIPNDLDLSNDLPPEEAELRQQCFRLAWARGWPAIWLDNTNRIEATVDAWRQFCLTSFPAWTQKARARLEGMA